MSPAPDLRPSGTAADRTVAPRRTEEAVARLPEIPTISGWLRHFRQSPGHRLVSKRARPKREAALWHSFVAGRALKRALIDLAYRDPPDALTDCWLLPALMRDRREAVAAQTGDWA